MQIDHIDADRTNNRITNLRDVAPFENRQNQRSANIDSTTGVKGVFLDKKSGKYEARIGVRGQVLRLGLFPDVGCAAKAYAEAAALVHTHNPTACASNRVVIA